MLSAILKKLISAQDLDSEQARSVMTEIMSGEAGDVRTAALLTALSCKGETGEEIQAFARAMRHAALIWPGPEVEILGDTCGTGGDSAGTINISTIAAILLASMGIPLAKHGNRAVSSKSGSADLLEKLGLSLDLKPEEAAECLSKIGICFLFAQTWHPAMKYAGPVRRSLGIRTVFNLLGPLTNPAPITHQVLGIYHPDFLEPMARALAGLGRRGAYALHADDGLDEVSTATGTHFIRIENGSIVEKGELTPEEFGFKRSSLEHLKIGSVEEAVERAQRILAGKGTNEENAAICMNAALLYDMAKGRADRKKAASDCLDALRSGSAAGLLDKWKSFHR